MPQYVIYLINKEEREGKKGEKKKKNKIKEKKMQSNIVHLATSHSCVWKLKLVRSYFDLYLLKKNIYIFYINRFILLK